MELEVTEPHVEMELEVTEPLSLKSMLSDCISGGFGSSAPGREMDMPLLK